MADNAGGTGDNGKDKKEKAPDLKRTFERAAVFNPAFFPAEIGIDPQRYQEGKTSSYAGVDFHSEQGWIHGVHADVVPVDGGADIAIDHWMHSPDGENTITRFMEIEARPHADAPGSANIVITKAVVQGKALDLTDRKVLNAAINTCQQAMEQLRMEFSMPKLTAIAEKNGLKVAALPQTYKDGSVRFAYESGKEIARLPLRVPEQFVAALSGFNETGLTAKPDGATLFSASQRDHDDPMKEYTFYTQMKKGQDGENTVVALQVAHKNQDGDAGADPYFVHDVAKLTFRPLPEHKGLAELRETEINGRFIPRTDHLNNVRALHFARDSVMQAQAGVMPDMADIVDYTNLQSKIGGLLPLGHKEKQRYTYRVLGGTPSGPRLFKEDNSIGANCFLHLFEKYDDKNEYQSSAVIVDCGITPLDRKTGYDGMIAYAAEYLEHRTNQKHKPRNKAEAIVVTHPHIDHWGGIPHLLSAGYVIDHIVCNEATHKVIVDECKKLKIDPEWMPGKWTIAGADTDVKINDDFSVSTGWIPHSAITNWICVKTPEGSVFHYSDAKTDKTEQSHPGPDLDRIGAQKPTMVVFDSTRAHEKGKTEEAQSLENRFVESMKAHPGKAPVTIQMGGNYERMATVINAYGREKRNTVIFGAALQRLHKVFNAVGLRNGQKPDAYARTTFGTRVLNYSPGGKAANAIVHGPIEQQGILATGTGNEPMSILNKLVENRDRRRLSFITPQTHFFVMSQTPIPGKHGREWEKAMKWMERRGYESEVIHASGHGSEGDILEMADWVKARYGVATHGDAEQRGNLIKVIEKAGLEPINPNEQDVIQVSDKNGCKIVAQEPLTVVYYSEKKTEGQPWGDPEDIEYFPYSVRPEIRTPVGEIMVDISNMKRGDEEHASFRERRLHSILDRDAILNSESTSLKPYEKRVKISLPDYLLKTGLLRRITYDTETTQLGPYAFITQFAAKRVDWADPKSKTKTKWLNIRQTLPEKVLPDLEALLTTGLRPADLYKTGKDYYQPRQFYYEAAKFLEESKKFGGSKKKPPYTRIWIDNAQKPADPSSASKEKDGKDPYMRQSVKATFDKESKYKDPQAIKIRTAISGFNNTRSDDVWFAHAAFRAGSMTYSPANTNGMRRFDVRNMARMFAYLRPDAFKVRAKPDNPEFLDFTVEGIMKANNLTYSAKAHDANADVDMTDTSILEFMLNTDPELFTQAMLNSSTREIKKFLAGTHNGMLYPRPLVTYINTYAKGARANIGVYVGRSTKPEHRSKALLFNVSDFDPRDFEHMTVQQMASIIGNPSHKMNKAFEIVQINKHPLLASADRGIAVGANRGSTIETMKAAKHFIERNPKLAANMVAALEVARYMRDPDPELPMEERIYAPYFMDLSSHDRELAKLFEPVGVEFEDEKEARRLNRARAQALDNFHSIEARERYVAVLYEAEREFKHLFGKEPRFFQHPEDREREQAKEKARVHGLSARSGGFDRDPPVSIGMLEAQIKRVKAEWDTRWAKDQPAEKVALRQQILKETEAFVQDIKTRIANNDPEWTLSAHDFKLLGLDDSKPHGRYRAPIDKNPGTVAATAAARRKAPGPS